MRPSVSLVVSLATLVAQSVAYPHQRPSNVVRRQTDTTPSSPYGTNGAVSLITELNTLNSTVPPPFSSNTTFPQAIAAGQLQIAITNNFPSTGSVNAYITGLDANDRLVMIQPDGNFYYPTSGNSSTPTPITDDAMISLGSQGSVTAITIPGWLSAGRIWIAEGTLQFFVVEATAGIWSLVEPSVTNMADPNAYTNFGFVELTNSATEGLWVNISFVDFVGLALGISVTSSADGSGDTSQSGLTQTVPGLSDTAAAQICSDLQAQAAIDNQPWGDLCITSTTTNSLIRVLSPGDYMSINPTAFSDYWSSYVSSVWSTYSSEPLIIDTQSSAGNVSCTVSNNSTLTCDGDNRGYAPPTSQDIFTCNTGAFSILESDNDVHRAVVPRLCAAINRSTLLLDGGGVTPELDEESYYTVSPTNYYSKFVHQYEAGGIGYAFSYDDVAPDGGINQSGLLVSTSPTLLGVMVQGASG